MPKCRLRAPPWSPKLTVLLPASGRHRRSVSFRNGKSTHRSTLFTRLLGDHCTPGGSGLLCRGKHTHLSDLAAPVSSSRRASSRHECPRKPGMIRLPTAGPVPDHAPVSASVHPTGTISLDSISHPYSYGATTCTSSSCQCVLLCPVAVIALVHLFAGRRCGLLCAISLRIFMVRHGGAGRIPSPGREHFVVLAASSAESACIDREWSTTRWL